MRKLFIALCACTAIIPSIASAEEYLNHLPPPGTAIGAVMQTSHNVAVCKRLDDVNEWERAWMQATHRIKPFITTEELSRRRPEGCGLIYDGKFIVVRKEAVIDGAPRFICQAIYRDEYSATNSDPASDTDDCNWSVLPGEDWAQIASRTGQHY